VRNPTVCDEKNSGTVPEFFEPIYFCERCGIDRPIDARLLPLFGTAPDVNEENRSTDFVAHNRVSRFVNG
jgi:hypothetical protein